MTDFTYRTSLLIGDEGLKKIKDAKVALFGLGGVGGYVLEGLVRSGVGEFLLVDCDVFDVTNKNRQILATDFTIGRRKTEVAKERAVSINPEVKITVMDEFVTAETVFDFSSFDYVIDAVDNVTAKLNIISSAKKYSVPIITSMGTGNKLDPSKFEIADISKTHTCPLAKAMRKLLKERNITGVKALFSSELPVVRYSDVVASISFVPSVAGLLIAAEVVKDIISSQKGA